MAMDFPNSPTAGQSFTSGGTTWVWTVPPSAWKATAGPSGGASYLPITGGQLNPGGLLIGTAGSVPAGAGLMINAAASAPAVAVPIPAGVSIIGDAGGEARVFLDSYSGAGGAITPGLYARKARGTAAAPTAVQTNDALFVVDCSGRGATGYGPSASTYLAVAAENWSDTAQGTYTAFYTTNLGTTTAVQRMFLRQGLIVGPLATPDPGPGNLTLNANTVAPPAGLTPNLYVVGANNAGAVMALDAFGTANGQYLHRRARGTATAPTAVQNGDFLGGINTQGAISPTAYGNGGSALFSVTENWTASANGCGFTVYTTPNGQTAGVASLSLQGNSATFSGTILTPGSIYLGSVAGTASAQISADSAQVYLRIPGGLGNIIFQNNAGSTNVLLCDNNGNLTISGSNAQKASGTTWSNPSSRDIKEDIKDYDAGLQAVLKLRPRTYKFREDSGFETKTVHIGLVHDETKHMPEMHRTLTLGSGDDAREVDGLDCSAVTWALVNAVKELQAEIEKLKGKKS